MRHSHPSTLVAMNSCKTMTPNMTNDWLQEPSVKWWKTPAESPDLNLIENLRHELKEFIRREVKPKTKDELIQGMQQFLETVDKAKCTLDI